MDPIDYLLDIDITFTEIDKKDYNKKTENKEKYAQLYKNHHKKLTKEEKCIKLKAKNKYRRERHKNSKKNKIKNNIPLLDKNILENNFKNNLSSGCKIIFDLSFEKILQNKEIMSLCRQISTCYSLFKWNKDSKIAYMLYLKNDNSITNKCLTDNGFNYWICGKYNAELNKDLDELKGYKLVYLSPDADKEIKEFKTGKYGYIIGGIVDNTVIKDLSKNRANELNIKCRKLPLDFIKKNNINMRPSLNINTICEIIDQSLNVSSKPIEDCILDNLPKRYIKNKIN